MFKFSCTHWVNKCRYFVTQNHFRSGHLRINLLLRINPKPEISTDSRFFGCKKYSRKRLFGYENFIMKNFATEKRNEIGFDFLRQKATESNLLFFSVLLAWFFGWSAFWY